MDQNLAIINRRHAFGTPKAVGLSGRLVGAQSVVLSGMVNGFLSGLLGVGGGFVLVPALQRYAHISMKSAVATPLAVIALVSVGGVLCIRS